MLKALRAVLRQPHAQWRNEGQHLAVIAGLEWKTDLVVILPTGSGKSAIITTIAHLEKNTVTAVLCPLRSLLADWQRRLDNIGFPYSVFQPSRPFISDQKPLVLVSLDVTDGHSWRQAVSMMRSEAPLVRIVIDEAHLVLTEVSYRAVMTHVKELRQSAIQLALLSATIPPVAIPQLGSSFTLASNPLIIRATSNRPELHFHMPVSHDVTKSVCMAIYITHFILI